MPTTNYAIKATDRLLRFDTTNGDVIATLLPFAQTPNAPYEVHKISAGDGHTVTIQVTATTNDFLLPDGSLSIVLDDANDSAIIKIPADGASPAFVTTSGTGGGSGGGGNTNVPAPDVSITGPAEVFFRSNNQVEVNIAWAKAGSATAVNFQGVYVYLEDPDISLGPNIPLDGSAVADGSQQLSGTWAPVMINQTTVSPAVVMLDSTMGTVTGQTYKGPRNVRIYLCAYGPYSQPNLIRATSSGASPSILVEIGQGPDQYQSGMEWAFLAANPHVDVNTSYNDPSPSYSLTYKYDPPDPSIPLPPGVNMFGGCRIVNVQEDASGNPVFPGEDTGISVPVAQAGGFKTPVYPAKAAGLKYWAYFCSEDNAHPLGSHINSLVPGVTPRFEVSIPQVNPAPPVTNFAISGQTILRLLNQTFVAQALFSWSLPTAAAGGVRYAGVFLYLVNVTGTAPLTGFPVKLSGQQSNVDTSFPVDISNIPANPEVWTIAAISVDVNGALADKPETYGQPGFQSPTVVWNIGPPVPGSAGSGTEYAPLVGWGSATLTAAESTSADGIRMVSFAIGPWTNPGPTQGPGQFGGAQVAMIVNGDTTKPIMWSVPANHTSFQTPPMASFGNIGGAPVPVDVFVVSDDPQGHKNQIVYGVTPGLTLPGGYVPTAGQIIPARTGWFDESQFTWDTTTGNVFKADKIEAQYVFVDKVLRVGGGLGGDAASFQGNTNGQIAVYNASNTLRAWIGEQQPSGQGLSGAPLWGGWFGQLWVAGDNPLNAPFYIDSHGIIVVGGIAPAQPLAPYPYISIRDQTGLEAGRIGAMISANTGLGPPLDNTGGYSGPTITAGAWFTQLAVGGSNLLNWNVLITPDLSNPLGSNFQMRNINLLSIDYAALSGNPSRNEYKLDFGNSVWMAGGLPSGVWQFPGIHIYEIDGNASPNFGATFINRGVVLRGTARPSGESSPVYPVLVSLVTFNADQNGSDLPAQFFGVLAMNSPLSPYTQNVVIASGSGSGTAPNIVIDGHAYMRLADQGGNTLFSADLNGCSAKSFSLTTGKAVIDSAGNWVGNAISGGGQPQTPWAQDIQANSHSLVGANEIHGAFFYLNTSPVINASAQFVGSGGVNTSGAITTSGTATAAQFNVTPFGAVINSSGQFLGNVNTVQGITCGSLSTNGGGSYGELDCGHIVMENVGAGVAPNIPVAALIQVNGSGQRITCASNGIWSGQGVQTASDVYSGRFGIEGGGASGVGSNFLGLTANSGNQFTLTTSIGNLTVRIIGGLICAG